MFPVRLFPLPNYSSLFSCEIVVRKIKGWTQDSLFIVSVETIISHLHSTKKIEVLLNQKARQHPPYLRL